MNIQAFQQLSCPIDSSALQRHEKNWCCDNGHSFDIAKQGYTNLLPVQNKRSLEPGDHKNMVAARRRFLNADYYLPLAKAVNDFILTNNTHRQTLSVLDAGCGEGYYLRQLAAAEGDFNLAAVGVDISKWAVLAAAQQEKNLTWLVASNANLPVAESSLDCVLCMFGFPVYKEFSRVLKTGGYLLQVDAGSEHLKELREIIYANQKKEKLEQEKTPEGFNLVDNGSVRYTIHLNTAEAIGDLLAMTPHLYRASEEGLANVRVLTALTLTVDVKISAYKKIE